MSTAPWRAPAAWKDASAAFARLSPDDLRTLIRRTNGRCAVARNQFAGTRPTFASCRIWLKISRFSATKVVSVSSSMARGRGKPVDLELSSDEICKELKLTPTNLYVQLHRARLRLRECLELNWFGRTKNATATTP